MKKNRIYSLTLSVLLFSACSTKNIEPKNRDNNITKNYAYLGIDDSNSTAQEVDYYELKGDFQDSYELIEFIEMMANKHNFKRKELYKIFSKARNYRYVPSTKTKSCISNHVYRGAGEWDRYKSCFIYEKNIQRGIEFWNRYRDTLERAEQEYGVPPEYIVGIIGIETAYGTNFGKHRALDVLTTRSMLWDRRSDFYKDELEDFLLITRDLGLDPTEVMGSTSGALGYGQFMPSSYIRFAVDFNNDGVKDLWDAEDAIGSIANYFAKNGWNPYIDEVAVRAKYKGYRFKKLKTGYKTKYSQYKLKRKHKIKPRSKMKYRGPVSLLRLNRAGYDELWLGTHNFRVITTYNHSSLYGMAVYKLANEIKKRIEG
ncbi:MAG: lytic murein transglycosylase B [Epsilonproteobacteria bacterium]|nr:lytic murein transglycosylase B [Campylobacterota bacterium]